MKELLWLATETLIGGDCVVKRPRIAVGFLKRASMLSLLPYIKQLLNRTMRRRATFDSAGALQCNDEKKQTSWILIRTAAIMPMLELIPVEDRKRYLIFNPYKKPFSEESVGKRQSNLHTHTFMATIKSKSTLF